MRHLYLRQTQSSIRQNVAASSLSRSQGSLQFYLLICFEGLLLVLFRLNETQAPARLTLITINEKSLESFKGGLQDNSGRRAVRLSDA